MSWVELCWQVYRVLPNSGQQGLTLFPKKRIPELLLDQGLICVNGGRKR